MPFIIDILYVFGVFLRQSMRIVVQRGLTKFLFCDILLCSEHGKAEEAFYKKVARSKWGRNVAREMRGRHFIVASILEESNFSAPSRVAEKPDPELTRLGHG